MSELGSLILKIRSDIHFFVEQVMRFKPTWQQRQLFQAVQDAQMGRGSNWIAVRSGQGPGKTTASCLVALWRTLRSIDALTIVTAPTMRQCSDVWLTELNRLVEKANPFIKQILEITKTRVIVAGRRTWSIKLVAAKTADNARGYHQKNMTVICEEASGVPREIVTQFKGTLSNPDALYVMIGNPSSRDSAFFDAFYGVTAKRWAHFVFNAEDTARDYPHIVNPRRNQDIEEEFGRESDVYKVNVLGEFPSTDPNCVISSEWVIDAFDESKMLPYSMHPTIFSAAPPRVFGIDFARYGGNENVVYQRCGYSIIDSFRQARIDPSQAVEVAFKMQARLGWSDDSCIYIADAGGIGQGILNNFYRAGKQVHEFHSSSPPISPTGSYANKYSEAWFHIAKLLKERRIYVPRDTQLLDQLSTRRYYLTKKNKLIIESKDEYAKRGFESPDRADALAQAFYDYATQPAIVATKNSLIRGNPYDLPQLQ